MNIKLIPSKFKGIVMATPSGEMALKILLCEYLQNNLINKSIFNDFPEKYLSETIKNMMINLERINDRQELDLEYNDSVFSLLFPSLLNREQETILNNCDPDIIGNFDDIRITLVNHGCQIDRIENGLKLKGNLKSGRFDFANNVNHWFLSGVLCTLPLLNERSILTIKKPYCNFSYIKTTIAILERYGVRVRMMDDGDRIIFSIMGKQKYKKKQDAPVDGSWMNMSPWIAANHIGHKIVIKGLLQNTAQTNGVALEVIQEFRKDIRNIDIINTPDLFPIFLIMAVATKGETNIKNINILDEDKLKNITNFLDTIECSYEINEEESLMKINGVGTYLRNRKDNIFDCGNDPSIIMALTIFSPCFRNPIVLKNVEGIKKIYPNFFLDYKVLGGKLQILSNAS